MQQQTSPEAKEDWTSVEREREREKKKSASVCQELQSTKAKQVILTGSTAQTSGYTSLERERERNQSETRPPDCLFLQPDDDVHVRFHLTRDHLDCNVREFKDFQFEWGELTMR